eukprot:g7693.t1
MVLRNSIYHLAVVLGFCLAFIASFGIGANDGANAFATSVGSKAITLRQAVLLAGVFEFAGAVLVGAQVEETIREDIVDPMEFEREPYLLMYGMLCVLAATGLWLLIASYLEIPVSTTHSLVGGIVGMSIVAKGLDSVQWYRHNEEKGSNLEEHVGVAAIAASWAISPILSGLISAAMFYLVRRFILRVMDSERRAYLFFPFLVGFTVTINTYFVLYKGFSRKFGKKTLKNHLGGWSHIVALGIGGVCSVVALGLLLFNKRRKTLPNRLVMPQNGVQLPQTTQGQFARHVNGFETEEDQNENEDNPPPPEENHIQNYLPWAGTGVSAVKKLKKLWKRVSKKLFERDLHAVIQEDETVSKIHEGAEPFDKSTEDVFKYLQVFTAICDSFAHGANDVANSVGPLSVIYHVHTQDTVSNEIDIKEWILVIGAVGIVIGLVSYGYNMIRAMGVKLTKITPSRGFAIELGSAAVVVVGSSYGIPLSTTYCQVGSTVAVGLLEGYKGVNFGLFTKMFGGWIATLIVASTLSAAFFAQGAYSPSIVNLRDLRTYKDAVHDTFMALNNTYSSVNFTQSQIEDILGSENRTDLEVYDTGYQTEALGRRPRNQLTALRKHRSIIFRSISLDSTNDSASVFIPSRTNTNGRKKKITNQLNSGQYLTESVLLPSGVVVQLPINLKGSTTKQRKSSGNSNRKSNKKSSPVLGEEQYVSSPIGKRKAQFEADLTLSIRSVTKRGRLTRKGASIITHLR